MRLTWDATREVLTYPKQDKTIKSGKQSGESARGNVECGDAGVGFWTVGTQDAVVVVIMNNESRGRTPVGRVE